MCATVKDALLRAGAVTDDDAAGVRGASPCQGCSSGELRYSHHQKNQVRHPRRVEDRPLPSTTACRNPKKPHGHHLDPGKVQVYPKSFPKDAVDAASGKGMRSGFGMLSSGGSGFPANGEEVKGLVLHVLKAQSSFGRLLACEKL